ncbi:MAG: hypothetical protein ACLUOF_08965 [Ruminococcus sp.]
MPPAWAVRHENYALRRRGGQPGAALAAYTECKRAKNTLSLRDQHHAILHTLKQLKKRAFVTLLEVSKTVSSPGAGRRYPTGHRLVSVMFASNETVPSNPLRRSAQSAGKRACCSIPTLSRRWGIFR